MIYNRSLQTLINAVVVVLVVAGLVVAAVGFIPTRSPLGPLLGKMSSDAKSTSALISALDPKAIGQALKDNPEFVVEVMKYMDPKGTAIALRTFMST